MNWESLVEILMDKVPDAEIRQSIYKALLDQCDYSETDVIDEAMGVDQAFDIEAQEYLDFFEEPEDDDEDEDEDNYDYEDED